jgi:hypothetical protein
MARGSLRRFGWIALLVGWAAAPSAALADGAEAAVERMLQALGGRAAWVSVTNTVNDSQQNILVEPAVLRVVITMDLERPRVHIDTSTQPLPVCTWRVR